MNARNTARARHGRDTIPGGWSSCRQARRHAGFTLHEVIVVLAIATTLMALGSRMGPILADSRSAAELNEFLTYLHLARSEAVKRRNPVTLCTSADGLNCASHSGWEAGWIIFSDLNANRRVDVAETVLHVHQSLERGDTLRFRAALGRNQDVTYFPTGYTEKNGTFTLCDGRGSAGARAIILYRTGRPRIGRRNAGGGPLDCES